MAVLVVPEECQYPEQVVPLLRWLLPIVAALCVLGGSVAAYAAAGWTGDRDCCCPAQRTCKCDDHNGQTPEQPTLKRCSGDAQLVTPAPVPGAVANRVDNVAHVTVVAIAAPVPMKLSSAPPREPEKPPF